MLKRCRDPRHIYFAKYGGRGITVCARWSNFPEFLADMGPRPSLRHSIDRIDNDGNYELSNCRWATPAQQQRNRRDNKLNLDQVTDIRKEYIFGITSYQKIADKYGVALSHIYNIVKRRVWIEN